MVRVQIKNAFTKICIYTLVSFENEIISFIFLTVFMFLFFYSVCHKMLCLFKEGKNNKKTHH